MRWPDSDSGITKQLTGTSQFVVKWPVGTSDRGYSFLECLCTTPSSGTGRQHVFQRSPKAFLRSREQDGSETELKWTYNSTGDAFSYTTKKDEPVTATGSDVVWHFPYTGKGTAGKGQATALKAIRVEPLGHSDLGGAGAGLEICGSETAGVITGSDATEVVGSPVAVAATSSTIPDAYPASCASAASAIVGQKRRRVVPAAASAGVAESAADLTGAINAADDAVSAADDVMTEPCMFC